MSPSQQLDLKMIVCRLVLIEKERLRACRQAYCRKNRAKIREQWNRCKAKRGHLWKKCKRHDQPYQKRLKQCYECGSFFPFKTLHFHVKGAMPKKGFSRPFFWLCDKCHNELADIKASIETPAVPVLPCQIPPGSLDHSRDIEIPWDTLHTRSQVILKQRFFERKTLQQIAELWGVTRERIRQVESKAFRTLRFHLLRDGEIRADADAFDTRKIRRANSFWRSAEHRERQRNRLQFIKKIPVECLVQIP